jgi:hypothetical protein
MCLMSLPSVRPAIKPRLNFMPDAQKLPSPWFGNALIKITDKYAHVINLSSKLDYYCM